MKKIILGCIAAFLVACGNSEPVDERADQLSGVGIGSYFSMYDGKRYKSLVTKTDVLDALNPSATGEVVKVDEKRAGELAQAYVDNMFPAEAGKERLTVSSTHHFPQSDQHYFYIVKFQAKNSASMLQVVVLSNGQVLPLEML